jgi:hypothetical protein
MRFGSSAIAFRRSCARWYFVSSSTIAANRSSLSPSDFPFSSVAVSSSSTFSNAARTRGLSGTLPAGRRG